MTPGGRGFRLAVHSRKSSFPSSSACTALLRLCPLFLHGRLWLPPPLERRRTRAIPVQSVFVNLPKVIREMRPSSTPHDAPTRASPLDTDQSVCLDHLSRGPDGDYLEGAFTNGKGVEGTLLVTPGATHPLESALCGILVEPSRSVSLFCSRGHPVLRATRHRTSTSRAI